mmetsp:Transcript_23405/g.33476  ORF Transcript_23405/g.33476 Transcript_23405/m.33476 type:complete len:87 (-) Transcript_23405:2386-2646(-)
MYEQEITKLRNANKVIEVCRVGAAPLHYYGKYITLLVTEYGLGSAYESGFIHSRTRTSKYIIALCMLIEMQKPLLEAEKKGEAVRQ